MLPEYFEFSLPTKLVYGNGIIENLNETVKPLGKRKADQIRATGAKYVVSPCANCKKQLREVCEDNGLDDVEVVGLHDLLPCVEETQIVQVKSVRPPLRSRETDDVVVDVTHAEIGDERHLIADSDGSILKTKNLLDMKTALAKLDARERVLSQRSSYDEMVGQGFEPADNAMEVRLGPGFETLPPWQT